jgi:FKBP-type peptidyl-prolyl cis-trans isomerase
MREGGKALFLMPSKLAYGSAGYYSIPGYTPLLFEVDLVKVKKR